MFKEKLNILSLNLNELPPLSVSWSPLKVCNYKCKFCYAVFEDIPQISISKISQEEQFSILKNLTSGGVSKITFVGGEPTLLPNLGSLISYAKKLGMTTMVVTNGSRITEAYVRENLKELDWFTISLDSLVEETERDLGRGDGEHVKQAYTAVEIIKTHLPNARLKLNTVVTKLNYRDSLIPFANWMKPERWKIFQFLPVAGENDKQSMYLDITTSEFLEFLDINHTSLLDPCIQRVAETKELMEDSYLLLDPLGRLYTCSKHGHVYSPPIQDVGMQNALGFVVWDKAKFLERGGVYSWQDSHHS